MYEYHAKDIGTEALPKSSRHQAGLGFVSQQGVIQRMVGMEFQVMGGGEDVCQYGSGGLEAVNHGIPLAAKTGYEITADMGDYEYVTAPVDERTDKGIQDLMTACDNAAKDHSNISTALGLSAKAPETKGYWKFGRYYLRQSAKMTAHPQATVGIKLDKLDTFVREYSKNLKTSIKSEYTGASGESEEFSNPANWPQTPEQLNLAHGGTYRELAEQQAEIIESIAGRPQNVVSIRNTEIAESVNGFLRILASMVQNLRAYRAAHKFGNPTNAKSVIPLMPRTSLYDIVRTFPIDVQKAIAGMRFNRIINFIYDSNDSNKSVPNNVLLAAQTYKVGKKVKTDELQLDKWLQNMPAATGSQKYKTTERKLMAPFSGVAELYGTAETRHNLYPGMTRSTDIGYDASGDPAKQVDGMLIEIRDLQRDVDLSNWKYVARDAALLTRFVNTGNIQEQAAQPEVGEAHPLSEEASMQIQDTLPQPAGSSSSTALEISGQSERETDQLSDSLPGIFITEVSEEMERIESMIHELPAEEAGGQGDALQADHVESHLPPLSPMLEQNIRPSDEVSDNQTDLLGSHLPPVSGQSRRQSPGQGPQNLSRRANPGHGNISFTQTNRLLGAVSSVRTTSRRTGAWDAASPVRRAPVNVVNLTFSPM